MKLQQIKRVKKWLELKSVSDIQLFSSFANFYYWFIKSFNKIVVLFIQMPKIIVLSQLLDANIVLATNDINSIKNIELTQKSISQKVDNC